MRLRGLVILIVVYVLAAFGWLTYSLLNYSDSEYKLKNDVLKAGLNACILQIVQASKNGQLGSDSANVYYLKALRLDVQPQQLNAFVAQQFDNNYILEFNGDSSKTESEVTLAYSYLKFNNMFRCDLLTGKVRPYIYLGLSNGLVMTVVNQHDWKNEDTGDGGGRALDEPKHYEQGILYGAGIDWKSFGMEWRMDHGSGMSNSMSLGSYLLRTSVLLHYRF